MPRLAKGCLVVLAAGVLAVAALLVALTIERHREVELPKPSGPFAVGRVIDDWAGDGRELLVWIWYPAAPRPSAAPADYAPPALRAAVQRRRRGPLAFLTRDWSKVRPHAIADADVSPRQRAYPVAILRGGASAEVVNYTTLAEDLASHGYVVVGFDAPRRTGIVAFPDGRVFERTRENNPETCANCFDRLLAAWTADIGWVLDQLPRRGGKLAGRVDMARVGVFGHSFGGSQAAQFCSVDPRCKAGIDIDGILLGSVVQTGIGKPFMFLLSDHSGESGAEHDRVERDFRSVYARSPRARYVVIPGANHFMFSDDGAVLKSRLLRGVMRLAGVLRIDARRQLAVTAQEIHSFFDAHL